MARKIRLVGLTVCNYPAVATRVEAVDASAPPRVRLRLALAAVALLAAAGSVALLVFWLAVRDYAPLKFASGQYGVSGAVRSVIPVEGSEGKTVYFAPQTRHARMSGYFDLTNTGDRPVRLERVYTERLIPGATPSFAIVHARIQTEPVNSSFSPRYSKPFRPLTIQPDQSVFLVLDYRTACSPTTPVGGSATGSWVDIRYSYLHVFHRTRTVDLPFAVAVQCRGKLPESTPVP